MEVFGREGVCGVGMFGGDRVGMGGDGGSGFEDGEEGVVGGRDG